jgi:Txe/YoeB family toxin of Txe-Axe toxin-antitoxin module
MVEGQLVYTNQAVKDAKKINNAGLKLKVEELLNVLKRNPF